MDPSKLPAHIRVKLSELEAELQEGDITRKGYEKKKSKLLEPFVQQFEVSEQASAAVSHRSSKSRRHEHHEPENRYRSDVREEAVKAALSRHREREMLPMPSKRQSFHTNVVPIETPPDSDTDDDSRSSTSSLNRLGDLKGGSRPLSVGSFRLPGMEPGFSEMVNRQAANGHISRGGARGLDVASNMSGLSMQASQPPPDVTTSSGYMAGRSIEEDEDEDEIEVQMPNSKVSAKIQQLLNTLKRPKKKPLQEFFQEDDDELQGNHGTYLLGTESITLH